MEGALLQSLAIESESFQSRSRRIFLIGRHSSITDSNDLLILYDELQMNLLMPFKLMINFQLAVLSIGMIFQIREMNPKNVIFLYFFQSKQMNQKFD